MEKSIIYRLIAVLTVLLLITAVVLGAVALSYDGNGDSLRVDLKRENIRYSAETALRYSLLMAPLFGTGNTLPPFDRLDKFVDNLYLSFSRAGVSEEKLNLILDRVEDLGLKDSTESPILKFIQSTYDEVTDGDDDATVENFVTAEQVSKAITDSYAFLLAANMTVDDVGRVLYEMALIYADGKRIALLTKLGKENFTMLTVGTYSVYKATEELSGDFTTLSEARVLGQALVSLGLSYRRAFDELGAEGIDELLFLDYRISADNTSINQDFAVKYNDVMSKLSGGVGSVLNFAACVLGGLSPLTFEELYFANITSDLDDSEVSDAHTVWAMFDFAKTFKNGISAAANIDENYADETQAVSYFCGLYADYKLLNDLIYNSENAPTRNDYYTDAKTRAEEFTENITALYSASENFADFDELRRYQQENPAGFGNLLENAEFISQYEFNLENAVIDVFSSLTKAAIIRIFTPQII